MKKFIIYLMMVLFSILCINVWGFSLSPLRSTGSLYGIEEFLPQELILNTMPYYYGGVYIPARMGMLEKNLFFISKRSDYVKTYGFHRNNLIGLMISNRFFNDRKYEDGVTITNKSSDNRFYFNFDRIYSSGNCFKSLGFDIICLPYRYREENMAKDVKVIIYNEYDIGDVYFDLGNQYSLDKIINTGIRFSSIYGTNELYVRGGIQLNKFMYDIDLNCNRNYRIETDTLTYYRFINDTARSRQKSILHSFTFNFLFNKEITKDKRYLSIKFSSFLSPVQKLTMLLSYSHHFDVIKNDLPVVNLDIIFSLDTVFNKSYYNQLEFSCSYIRIIPLKKSRMIYGGIVDIHYNDRISLDNTATYLNNIIIRDDEINRQINFIFPFYLKLSIMKNLNSFIGFNYRVEYIKGYNSTISKKYRLLEFSDDTFYEYVYYSPKIKSSGMSFSRDLIYVFNFFIGESFSVFLGYRNNIDMDLKNINLTISIIK